MVSDKLKKGIAAGAVIATAGAAAGVLLRDKKRREGIGKAIRDVADTLGGRAEETKEDVKKKTKQEIAKKVKK